MNYRCYKPVNELNDYLMCIWDFELDRSESSECCETLMPSGCIELVFFYRDSVNGYHESRNQGFKYPYGVVCGQRTLFNDSLQESHQGLISVTIRPEAAPSILGHPAHVFTDRFFCAKEIFGNDMNRLTEQLNRLKSFKDRVRLIENQLKKIIIQSDFDIDMRIRDSVDILSRTGGLVRSRKLADLYGLSLRQIERVFSASVGVSPKKFSNILRFQKTLALKQHNSECPLTDLAYQAGYADQAHFIKNFKSITGMTPGTFFHKTPAFSDYYSFY